ncbi:hypothetical protein CS559_02489 [Dickeya solani]|nr:hypothetical protein CS559_02489 [Dickeya solani]RJR98095.1 hypothetical protein CTB90_01179 [Dickeya solani]
MAIFSTLGINEGYIRLPVTTPTKFNAALFFTRPFCNA